MASLVAQVADDVKRKVKTLLSPLIGSDSQDLRILESQPMTKFYVWEHDMQGHS